MAMQVVINGSEVGMKGTLPGTIGLRGPCRGRASLLFE